MIANKPFVEKHSFNPFREQIVGIDQKVPILDGSLRPYVFLDNAASTPAFRSVMEAINQSLTNYASIHRGTGFKSLISTEAYERSREAVLDFLGGNQQTDCVIFGKNTTEAINILADAFQFEPGDVVVITLMEHHSNDLPWRNCTTVEHFSVDPNGTFDLNAFEDLIKSYRGKVKLVSTTGASNVSGFMPPIHDIAEVAHRNGAMILVDCAQMAPHRSIRMDNPVPSRKLDFVAISGHKMYAPFGTGALVGPREFFNHAKLSYRGGGTIEVVTVNEVHWAEAPERYEAGSPNVLGAVALAAAIKTLKSIGMEAVADHEKMLTTYALERLNKLQGIHLFGCKDPSRVEDRVGVIPLQVEGVPHGKVAAILSSEGAIGVRNGCFCAHPYVLHLLNISLDEFEVYKHQALNHDRSELPGLVRVSFGCYNTVEEIDILIGMLQRIVTGDFKGNYILDKKTGSYHPDGFETHILEKYMCI
jgi:cysteine desulfurase / selenocysteine lyase